MFVDTHCHLTMLDLTPYQGDLDQALAQARLAGVSKFMGISVDLDDHIQLSQIASRHADVGYTVGVHPCEDEQTMARATTDYLVELAQSEKVWALGETGLDYYHSTDFIVASRYDARLMDAGINFSAQYKINTGNKYDYTYGNKLSLATQAYYKIKIKKLTIAPNAGLQYETSSKDFDAGIVVDLSGGKILSGGFGVETNFNKIAIGANWQTPLSQNLGEGFIKANNRMMLHVAFAF